MVSRSYITSNKTDIEFRSKSGLNTGDHSENLPKQSSATAIKNTTSAMLSAGKRKAQESPEDEGEGETEFTTSLASAGAGISQINRPRKKTGKETEERRLRRHRAKPPGTYLERLLRVRTQRMFLIDRNRTLSADGLYEEEIFDIAGSTGNVYQVTISKIPDCTCPDASKGNQCKHIIYVMTIVLKAREDLAYQLALLSTELTEIFANAPVTPQSSDAGLSTSTDTGGSRKPIEGDCPVCVMEFEAGEDVTWCRAACGNNIHRHCFEQWAKSKVGAVKCVFCRTPWAGDVDSISRIAKGGPGTVNEEGYVNVAGELGISTQRDTSTYHSYWVNRQYGG